jgi:hypothetical protein
MTILQKPRQSGDGHARKGWHRFGHADEPVRHTDAWEHETFQEEQARWERSDPEYARICEEVRQAKGERASLQADEVKAKWDARVATQRQANDDAQRAHHALNADPTARRRTGTSRTGASRDTRAFPKGRSDAARGGRRVARDTNTNDGERPWPLQRGRS